MTITAKIRCTSKMGTGEGDNRTTPVSFAPDYQDGRNQEWAFATPSLQLNMTLRGAAADHFEVGKKYTLTFTPEETP